MRPVHARMLLLGVALALPFSAQAQEDEDDLVGIDAIVVTITKRSENLQQVAATISAFGEEAIAQADIQAISDVVQLIPNVKIKGDGDGAVSIRGVSQSFTSQAPVAMHMNGIWKFESGNSLRGAFYDLASIEVQRGPVGTVYGRNATAGAINVNWARPHASYEAKADATVGNHSLYQTRGMVNIPFLGEGDERLMGRFTFERQVRDNYNELLNRRSRDGGVDSWYLRGSLRSVITEDIELTVRGSFSRDDEADESQSRPIRVNGQFVQGLFNLGPLGAHPFDPLNGYQNFLNSLLTNPASAGLVAVHNSLFPGLTPQQGAARFISQGFPLFGVPAIVPALDTSLPITGPGGRDASNSSFGQVDGPSEASMIDAELRWALNDLPLLGDIEVRAVGGWDRWSMIQTPEADGTQLVILDTQSWQHRKTWVGEINISSQNEGAVSWLAGFFYFNSDHLTHNGTLTPFGLPPLLRSETESESKGYAPFAEVRVRPFELAGNELVDVELWGGVRYNHDDTSTDTFNPNPSPACNCSADGAEIFREVTYEFGARWLINDDHTIYGKFSKGYKPGFQEALFDRGTTSGNIGSLINSVDAEIIRAIEVGWKATWWDGRAQTTLAYFDYNYTNLQVPKITDSVVRTENAASATNRGVELELRLEPTDAWRVHFAAGYLDATFDEFCSNDELDFTAGDPVVCAAEIATGGPGFLDLSGNDLEDAPQFELSLMTSYTIDLGEMGTLTPIAIVTWTDDYYRRSFNNDTFDLVDAYTRSDFRLTWKSVDERYNVEFFIQNIENELVYARTIAVEIPTSAVGFGLLPPRVFGVRLGYHWGGE